MPMPSVALWQAVRHRSCIRMSCMLHSPVILNSPARARRDRHAGAKPLPHTPHAQHGAHAMSCHVSEANSSSQWRRAAPRDLTAQGEQTQKGGQIGSTNTHKATPSMFMHSSMLMRMSIRGCWGCKQHTKSQNCWHAKHARRYINETSSSWKAAAAAATRQLTLHVRGGKHASHPPRARLQPPAASGRCSVTQVFLASSYVMRVVSCPASVPCSLHA